MRNCDNCYWKFPREIIRKEMEDRECEEFCTLCNEYLPNEKVCEVHEYICCEC
ncbi:Uncharacterised protein [Turicibacter sanguinis]|nr:Uncharacterised protein [Turicibacter sanguinis]